MENSWEKFGQKECAWVESLYQGILALINVARSESRRGISYTDFTHKITAIPFDPHSKMLDQLLDDISTLEATAGRPMLSVLVRHKGGLQPGTGFYTAAERLGRKAAGEDNDSVWIREFEAAHDFWNAV